MTQRKPLRVPEISVPNQLPDDPKKAVKELQKLLRNVQEAILVLSRSQTDAYGSPLKKHGASHDTTGSDPLTTPGLPTTIQAGVALAVGLGPGKANEKHVHAISTAAPSNATGAAAAEGSAASLMRSDATVKQGIVAHKGALVTYDTAPAELTVGTDGWVLTADSAQAKGIKWAAAAGGSGSGSMARTFLLMGA